MIKRPQFKQDAFTKFRKSRIKGVTQPVQLKYDSVVGLQACENTKLSSSVLWSLKRAMQQSLARKAKIHLISFPHVGLTKKPSEVRMGKGRGSLSTFVARVRCGDLI
jgi:large subunit ribosomal protein L16